MSAAATFAALETRGYVLAVEAGRLKVRGLQPPPPDLERAITEDRDALKARVLLSDPPGWLEKLFRLYWSGHETPVRLTGTSGKAEVFMVSVSIKNIAAAVAAEIGMPVLEWERIRPEVEEALGTWSEGA
jgi:hypothetical protein